MTTYSIQYSRTEILTASLRKLGVLAQGQVPDSESLTNASMALNMVIAELRGIGMPLWQRKEFTWTPTTSEYEIGIGKTLNVPFPVRMLQAYRSDTSLAKVPIIIEALEDFNRLPVSPGVPLKLNYTPKINYGVIRLWPVPQASNTASITIIYQAPFEYMVNDSDSLSFPEEWYNAIVYKVAVLLAPEWGIPLPDRQELKREAEVYISNALASNQEDGSFFFSPDRNRY